MSETRQTGAEADDADRADETGFDAPERGSAEELLDARRHRRARTRCATRRRTSWPRPSWTCSRARSWASGRPSRTASTTTSSCRAPLTPDDLAAIEARMRDEHRGRPSVRAQRADARRGAARSSPSATSRSRSRSSTTSLRGGRARRHADAARRPSTSRARSSTCAAARTSRAPGKIGPFKLLDGRRRVLARRREAADAPARLRHGLGDAGGARPVPVAPRGGEEARPPPARRPARPVQLPRRLARARRSGTRRASASGGRSRAPCASSRSGAATRRSARRSSSRERLWQQSGHWDLYGDNMFIVESEDQTVQPQADELPGDRRSSTGRQLRSYRDLPLRFNEYGRLHRNERSGTLSGLTRVRQFIQDDAHIYVRPGPARRTSSRRSSARSARPTAGSASSRASRSRRSRTRRSAIRRSGSAPRR